LPARRFGPSRCASWTIWRPARYWRSALYSITGLRASAFAAKPDPKAFDQARTFTLLGEGDKVLGKVRIGGLNKDGTRRYVSSDTQTRVAEVEKGTVDELPKSLDDLLEPPPSPTPDAGSPTQAAK